MCCRTGRSCPTHAHRGQLLLLRQRAPLQHALVRGAVHAQCTSQEASESVESYCKLPIARLLHLCRHVLTGFPPYRQSAFCTDACPAQKIPKGCQSFECTSPALQLVDGWTDCHQPLGFSSHVNQDLRRPVRSDGTKDCRRGNA